jgi:Glycosyl transferases group 1
MTLHVAYVGNFSLPYCTEVHIARTLEQLGHRVTRLQENGLTPDGMASELDRLICGDRPDLFLFTRTWGRTVTMDHLDLLRRNGIPSVSYHLDLYVGLQRDGGIDTDPFWRTDFVFTPDGDPESAQAFAGKGINHRWLLPGVVADECYLANVPLLHDVIFCGSRQYHQEWPYRGQLLSWLDTTYGNRFEWWGPENGRLARGDDLNRLYTSSRVVVGDSLVLGFKHRSYASDRRYETPGRGGFMIHPRIAGIDDGFVDGVNTVFYDFGDFDGLRQRIDHYLTHDDERERIRVAGHEHVRANHTYTQRLTEMLDVLRTEGAIQ